MVTAGLSLIDATETQWNVLLRYGSLNRGEAPDENNSHTPAPQDIVSVDVTHSWLIGFGQVEIGAGVEAIDDATTGASTEELRGFLQWGSAP